MYLYVECLIVTRFQNISIIKNSPKNKSRLSKFRTRIKVYQDTVLDHKFNKQISLAQT